MKELKGMHAMKVTLRAMKQFGSSDSFHMASVADAQELGSALSKAYREYTSMKIEVDGAIVSRLDRESRYEWSDAEVSTREVNEKLPHTVWAWHLGSISFHTSFDSEYDAMAFATAAMKSPVVDGIQVESPTLGKQTDWKKERRNYWLNWVEVQPENTSENISEKSEQNSISNV